MRRSLLEALVCPHCGAAPLRCPGEGDVEDGEVSCPAGHVLTVRRGVLDALPSTTADIAGQLAEQARERGGSIEPDQVEKYTKNISAIGSKTYNELIRDNAASVLDAISVKGGRSLDLGGGSGWLSGQLAGRGFEAVSLDIQDPLERTRQIEEGAARRGFELVTDVAPELADVSVDFVLGDMERLPFADGTFDLVTTSAALHHSDDPSRTLKEAARVLKADGVLLCINEPVKGLFRDEEPIMGGRGDDAGEHIYWARTYLDWIHAAGFKTRLHFPGWVDKRLRQGDWEGVVYYKRLLPVIRAIWMLPGVRALVGGPLLRPSQDLFGLTLIVEARKVAGSSN